jgi:uncharacterized protein YkwD
MTHIYRILTLCLLAVWLAACAPPTTPLPTATPSLTPVLTATTTPSATVTATSQPSPTPQTGCTDSALFITDVTIPDETNLKQGQAFTKTWRLKNTGTCTWNSTYSLAFVSGEKMNGPALIPLAETLPGQSLDISADLTTPGRDGAFSGIYELHSPQRQVIPIGLLTSMWVKITVGTLPPTQVAGFLPTRTPFIPKGGNGSCQPSENGGYVAQLAGLINAARAEAQLQPLSLNGALSAAAQTHSLDMACNNFLDHRGSDGSWIGDRLAAAGYTTYNYTEIIAIGSPQDAMNQWRNSAAHWNAVLDATMRDFGVGYVYVADSSFGGYFTVDLASP